MRVIRILRAIKVVRLVGAVRFTQDLQLLRQQREVGMQDFVCFSEGLCGVWLFSAV